MTAAAFAPCQCPTCGRYLADNRAPGSLDSCTACGGTLRLSRVRQETDEEAVELLALAAEEAAEVVQRCTKITRWGMDADFAGTTQREKLEREIGDLVAAVVLLAHSTGGLVDPLEVGSHAAAKLDALRFDAAHARQHLLHAAVPGPRDASVIARLLVWRLVHQQDKSK